MALRAAFSRGSPTTSPSRRASDWQEASTHCVSNGASLATVMEIRCLDFEEGVEEGVELSSTELSLGLQFIYYVMKLYRSRQESYCPHSHLESCDPLHYQVVAGEGASLVETADVHFSTKRYPEWFSAVDSQLGQGY